MQAKKVDVKNDEIKTIAGKRYAWNAQLDPVDRMDFARNARTSTCPNQPKLLDATPAVYSQLKMENEFSNALSSDSRAIVARNKS